MLNNMKIGTKMMLGFAVVLVLLVGVYYAGRYAIYASADMTARIDEDNRLATQGFAIRKLILDGMRASDQGSLTHDNKFEGVVNDIVAEVKKIKDGIYHELDDANKKTVDEMMVRLDKFSDNDSDWYLNKKKAWEAALDQRAKHANHVTEQVETLLKNVKSTTKERFTLVQEGKTYLLYERVELELEIEGILAAVNNIRRLCFQIGAEFIPEEILRLREMTGKAADALNVRLAALAEHLTADRQLCNETLEEIKAWRQAMLHSFECEDAMSEQDKITQASAEAVNEKLAEFVKNLQDKVAETMKQSQAFDGQILWTILIFSGVAILLGLAISIILTQNITSGIKVAVEAMSKVAGEGDLEVKIDPAFLRRGDEIGLLLKGTEEVLHDYQSIDTLARHLARGEWTDHVKIKGPKDTMNTNLEAMLDQVNKTLHEIDESVRQVSTGAGEVSTAAQSLSNGAQESAASLEQITASMSEISGQTRQNAQGAGNARDLAQQATNAAAEGQEAMKKMNDSMDRIMKNSSEVQRVIKVIDDIAFQTNLLALNAAVEAARAGTHGKGFAVVAEEVRNLAARSAKAARETSDLIATSGKEIERGGEVSNHTADVLNTIVEQVRKTTDLIAGIAIASNEQAQGVGQVTIGLQQIDAVTQQNTASAEESASAANEMSGMAANLQKLVAQFKLR